MFLELQYIYNTLEPLFHIAACILLIALVHYLIDPHDTQQNMFNNEPKNGAATQELYVRVNGMGLVPLTECIARINESNATDEDKAIMIELNRNKAEAITFNH